MSPRGTTVAQRFAADLEDLGELARQHPDEADAIVVSLVAHLRAWRPESVAPLDAGFVPTETVPSRAP